MANVVFSDWHPAGYEVVAGPLALAEGDPAYTASLISETGLPNGTYRIDVQSTWTVNANRYFLFSAVIGGVESIQVAKESGGPSNTPNSASGFSIVEVTDGTLDYDLKYEFPTQAGNADGVLLGAEAAWARIA